jgi:hypothetical protein
LIVTGSIESTTGLTGSLLGTASYTNQALSSSFALTASYAANVPATASYALQALSSSYALTASYLDNYTPPFPFTGSAIITGSLIVTGSITSTQGFTGSLQGTASYANQTLTSSYLNTLNQDVTINGNVNINGTASIAYLNVTYESASVIYSSGSNQFGDATNDTQTLIGTTKISGSFEVTGSANIPSITGSLFGTASYANQALTASYALNGGVTQLLAGPNVTLSPTNGLGQVTVSATLSGSTIFNTATGSYGSFYDTTIQTNPIANVPRSMSFNSTDITNGVSISGSTNPFNTYIKTTNAGVYDIQFSAQVDKTDSGADEIVIWLRKNEIDLTDTATTLTLSGNNDKQVAAWNWFVTSAANDYYQIIWISADTNLRLLAETISATHPGIPSVIVTVNRVDQFLSNTGSFSGSFTGQFTGSLLGTASYADQALTASYASTYAPVFPFTGSAIITGSLGVTGSISNTTSVTTPIVNLTNTNNFLSGGGNTATLQALYQIQFKSSLNQMAEFNVASVNQINFTPYAGSLFSRQDFTFIAAAHTNQTAATNLSNFRIIGANKQWATGNITNQYWNYLTANTASFVGASTITSSYGLFVEAATAGTNATITNNFALGTTGRVQIKGSSSDLIDLGTNDGGFYNIKLAYNGVIGSTTGPIQLGNLGGNALGYYLPSNAAGSSVLANTWATGKITYQAYQHNFTFQSSANQSAEYSRLLITGGQVNFTSSISTQRFAYLTSPTIVFNTSNTVTSSYGLFVEAATAGTNATITNNYALGTNGNVIFDDSTSKMIWRAVPTIPSYSGIFLNVNPNSTNFTLANDGSGNTFLNGVSSVYIAANGTNVARFGATYQLHTPVAASSGALIKWQLTVPADTNQTLSTNIPNFRIIGANKQWATGNITNQYWNYLTANTASFVGASTVTSSYGLFVEAATAGTNATITNNYAAGFGGNVQIQGNLRMDASGYGLYLNTTNGGIWFSGALAMNISAGYLQVGVSFGGIALPDTRNIKFSTTGTGSKIGVSTIDKFAFWNATPIVQPTASTAIDTLLTNTGLRASGGGANFDTPITASIISASAFIGNLSGSATSASYATTSSYATNFVVEGTLVINETLTDSATINSSIVGSNNLFTQATGSYTSAFGKYTISNGSNARAGEFMTVWNGTTTTYTDTSTTDIGNTADITFTSAIVSSNIQIDAVAASSGWTIKMLTTFI